MRAMEVCSLNLIKRSDSLDVCSYGDEDQNELMHMINSYKEDEKMDNRIQNLMVEVETYRQAIQDAKDALASAEQELDEVLAAQYEAQ